MKATRRHDLKTNELAQRLVEARVFMQQHGTTVLGVLIAVVLAVGLFNYWRHASAQARALEWRSFYDLRENQTTEASGRFDQAMRIADQTDDPALARSALHFAGQLAWSEVRSNGQLDASKLESAIRAFNRIVTDFPDEPYTYGAACFHLAAIAEEQALEATDSSERERFKGQAREYYQRILDHEPLAKAPVRGLAKVQLAGLDERMQPVEIIEVPATQPATLVPSGSSIPSPVTTTTPTTAPVTTQPVAP